MATKITKEAKRLGLPLRDADRDEVVELTRDDITKGIPLSHNRCAFARACNRLFKIDGVHFYKSTAWLQTPTAFIRYLLPPNVKAEIAQYDAALLAGKTPSMKPGEYKLLKPAKSQTMKEFRKRSAKRKGRHQPAKVPTGIRRSVRFANTRLIGLPENVKTREQAATYLKVNVSKLKVNVADNAPERKTNPDRSAKLK